MLLGWVVVFFWFGKIRVFICDLCTAQVCKQEVKGGITSLWEHGSSHYGTGTSSRGDQMPIAPTVPLQAAGEGRPDTHPSRRSSWMRRMLSPRSLPAKVTAAPRPGAGVVLQKQTPEELGKGGGHNCFGKIPVCTTDSYSTHCLVCFWAWGYFWLCWQLFLFIQ